MQESQFHEADLFIVIPIACPFDIKVSFLKIGSGFLKTSLTWGNKVLAATYSSFPFNYVVMVVCGGGRGRRVRGGVSPPWNLKLWAHCGLFVVPPITGFSGCR